jgi:arginine utilization regulatory protein
MAKLTPEYLEQLNIYPEILENCDEGVNVANTDGILVYANRTSAEYCNATQSGMIGHSIEEFYPSAMMLDVMRTHQAIYNRRIHFIGKKRYMCSSFPIFDGDVFLGAFSIFRDVREIEELNHQVKTLQQKLHLDTPEDKVENLIGFQYGGTLNHIYRQARRTVGSLGGPRHSIITGESGTGKTMLANLIYQYAKNVGVIGANAPFIEINCAQFSNPDIAAMEIFGSEEGAYTGSKTKKGLFEQASGGILFLDEAHALDHYQNMLLKAIESGQIRRIGGSRPIPINVIIIAASTRKLEDVFMPELYQRLAQYEMHLPALRERSQEEKEYLLNYFIRKYEDVVQNIHQIRCRVSLTEAARSALLNAEYPRNVRQFRDVINSSIDAASPLLEDIGDRRELEVLVSLEDIPFEISSRTETAQPPSSAPSLSGETAERILRLSESGLGPRKIARRLSEQGLDIPYYKIAYFLKNKRP